MQAKNSAINSSTYYICLYQECQVGLQIFRGTKEMLKHNQHASQIQEFDEFKKQIHVSPALLLLNKHDMNYDLFYICEEVMNIARTFTMFLDALCQKLKNSTWETYEQFDKIQETLQALKEHDPMIPQQHHHDYKSLVDDTLLSAESYKLDKQKTDIFNELSELYDSLYSIFQVEKSPPPIQNQQNQEQFGSRQPSKMSQSNQFLPIKYGPRVAYFPPQISIVNVNDENLKPLESSKNKKKPVKKLGRSFLDMLFD